MASPSSTSLGHAEYGDAARRDAQYSAAVSGGLKGAGVGLGLFAPGAYFLHRSSASFRGLSLPVKAMFVTMGVAASGVWSADRAGIRFDREHYSDRAAKLGRQYATREQRQWAELSTRDKTLTWAKDNKFAVVAGSWVTSMGVIFAYIHTQPMSFSQKLVQTRVWAQGFTLASLLAMAAITQIPSAGDKILEEREHAAEHSWKDFIADADAEPSSGRPTKSKSSPAPPPGQDLNR